MTAHLPPPATRAEVTPVIEVEHLSTRFGQHWVHRDLNLVIEKGEVMALVGGSGSGKTTLLRQMVGLLYPTQGQIRLFGEPLFTGNAEQERNLRRRFGMLFQYGALYSSFTVFQNIAPNATCTIGAVALQKTMADPGRDRVVALGAGAGRARQPGEEAASRHTERVAHPTHRPNPSVLRNETKHHAWSFAK